MGQVVQDYLYRIRPFIVRAWTVWVVAMFGHGARPLIQLPLLETSVCEGIALFASVRVPATC